MGRGRARAVEVLVREDCTLIILGFVFLGSYHSLCDAVGQGLVTVGVVLNVTNHCAKRRIRKEMSGHNAHRYQHRTHTHLQKLKRA